MDHDGAAAGGVGDDTEGGQGEGGQGEGGGSKPEESYDGFKIRREVRVPEGQASLTGIKFVIAIRVQGTEQYVVMFLFPPQPSASD
jgi:hypothetical protein